ESRAPPPTQRPPHPPARPSSPTRRSSDLRGRLPGSAVRRRRVRRPDPARPAGPAVPRRGAAACRGRPCRQHRRGYERRAGWWVLRRRAVPTGAAPRRYRAGRPAGRGRTPAGAPGRPARLGGHRDRGGPRRPGRRHRNARGARHMFGVGRRQRPVVGRAAERERLPHGGHALLAVPHNLASGTSTGLVSRQGTLRAQATATVSLADFTVLGGTPGETRVRVLSAPTLTVIAGGR